MSTLLYLCRPWILNRSCSQTLFFARLYVVLNEPLWISEAAAPNLNDQIADSLMKKVVSLFVFRVDVRRRCGEAKVGCTVRETRLHFRLSDLGRFGSSIWWSAE